MCVLALLRKGFFIVCYRLRVCANVLIFLCTRLVINQTLPIITGTVIPMIIGLLIAKPALYIASVKYLMSPTV